MAATNTQAYFSKAYNVHYFFPEKRMNICFVHFAILLNYKLECLLIENLPDYTGVKYEWCTILRLNFWPQLKILDKAVIARLYQNLHLITQELQLYLHSLIKFRSI